MDPPAHEEGSPYNGSPYIGDIALQPPSPTVPAYDFDYHHPSATFSASYNNSPYSNHSELSLGEEDPPLSLFDEKTNDAHTDYNPTEYDSNNFGSLLMFNDSDYMPQYDQQSHLGPLPLSADFQRSTFDHGSPSSNGGGESGGENPDYASRRSSVSSHQFSPSPRMDVAQSFENMTFASPNWGTEPLPRDGRTPDLQAQQKAQSPPRLMMPPDSTQSPPEFPAPPMINAPEGDGSDAGGPSVRIVPATPVSGGGTGSNVPFQTTLHTLNQGVSLPGQQPSQNWNLTSQPGPESLGAPYSNFEYPNVDVDGANALSNQGPHSSPSTNFLFPQSRTRSKSDTSLEPPNWDTSARFTSHESAIDDGAGTDHQGLGSHSPSPSAHQTNFSPSHPPINLPYTFSMSPNSPPYLTPDMGRRSRSERPSHVRQTRSEDYGPQIFSFGPQDPFVPGQFLSPQDSPATGMRVPGMGLHGHYRRASSGSRSERGVSAGAWSGASSGRGSPYPSPNVSPRGRIGELPSDDQPLSSVGQATIASSPMIVSKMNVTTGRTANASHRRRKQEATFVCPVPGCGSTFTRSFNLKGHIRSHNEEKPFQCHWPGCGKGFARQHDCKRHEQLHTNYRPFTCDGCNKPFARMDALNRHLRSEGGAECKRILEANGNLPNLGGETSRGRKTAPVSKSPPMQKSSPAPKTEPEMWAGVTV